MCRKTYPEYGPKRCPHSVVEPKHDKIRDGFIHYCKRCGEVVCDSTKKEGPLVYGKATRLSWKEKELLK